MGVFDSIGNHSSSGGLTGAILRLVLRFFQFILALVVAGLYGVDLQHAHDQHGYIDGKWVFAEVVAGVSAFTCIIYGIPFIKSYVAFGWDWILFVLWAGVFGLFGRIFIPANPTPKQTGQIRMKHAVWVDCASMILWFLTAVYSTIIFFRGRQQRSISKV